MAEDEAPLGYLLIRKLGDVDRHLAAIRGAAARSQEWIGAQTGDPLELLRQLKFSAVGRHPIEDRSINFIEQVNQTWTYVVALRAAAQLMALHPDAGGFTVERAYARGTSFQPQFLGDGVERYLLQLVAISSGWMDREETWFEQMPPVEVVTLKRPPTNASHLLGLLDAIRRHAKIEIDYRSMTGTPASWRLIGPHAIAHSAGRWYVRGWSSEHGDFRDYNVNRIRGVRAGAASMVDYTLDYEWHQKIDLVLSPNPKLDPDRQAAVREEYGIMAGGKLAVAQRLSLSFYFMAEHNLDVDDGVLKPEKQQLVLENRQDVEAARRLARAMSKQALQRLVVEPDPSGSR
jgi:hypothetical protein